MTRCAIAVDLGGTETRAAIISADGTILASAIAATPARETPEVVIAGIEDLAARVRGERPDLAPLGAGVAAPGPLDPETGIVIEAPSLTGWRDVPLAALLRERLRMDVQLENDANAAALGEWRFGAGRGTRSLVFVTVSTGIGGGVILDGRLLHGRQGLAAEIGHMAVTSSSAPCFCGAIGCWEAVASGTALARSAAERLADGALASTLRDVAQPITGRAVIEAARAGDTVAESLVQDCARWLGIGIVNLLHLYSPERVILGGGISHGLDILRPTIARVVAERALRPYRDVPILAATLGRHAGLVGVASLILSPG